MAVSYTHLDVYKRQIQYAVFKVRMPQALAFGNGDGEIRTHDPLLARQVLSQLSYTPMIIWHSPALPCRLQHSTIGRLGLNLRVRDENGCFPETHQHQKSRNLDLIQDSTVYKTLTSSSLERR